MRLGNLKLKGKFCYNKLQIPKKKLKKKLKLNKRIKG